MINNDIYYKKREYEKSIMLYMIKVYCKHCHKKHYEIKKTFGSKDICKECEEVYNYSKERTDKCKFIATKTFCSACPSHCYKKDMKEKIKKIMSFSSKRMFFYNPIMTLKHLIVMMKHR